MRHQEGFTLLENMIGMTVLLAATVSIAPTFSQGLVLGNVLWERRQALKVIERTLEDACNAARTSGGFTTLTVGSLPAAAFPQELSNPSRVVTCVDDITAPPIMQGCPASPQNCTTLAAVTRKRIDVKVCWQSKGRAMEEMSAPYLISKMGVCGTGQP